MLRIHDLNLKSMCMIALIFYIVDYGVESLRQSAIALFLGLHVLNTDRVSRDYFS